MPKLRGDAGRPRTPINPNACPAVFDLEALQAAAHMTDGRLLALAGYSRTALRNLRRDGWPPLRTLSEFAQVFGYEVHLVPKGTPDSVLTLPQIQSLSLSLSILGYTLTATKESPNAPKQ